MKGLVHGPLDFIVGVPVDLLEHLVERRLALLLLLSLRREVLLYRGPVSAAWGHHDHDEDDGRDEDDGEENVDDGGGEDRGRWVLEKEQMSACKRVARPGIGRLDTS